VVPEVWEYDVSSAIYKHLVVDPMILESAADITRPVAINYQRFAVGSAQKPLLLTNWTFLWLNAKSLDMVFYISDIRINEMRPH
jgi:hypothetical protein